MEPGQIISFNENAFIGLQIGLQIGLIVISIGLTILMIYFYILGIKALKMYIKKNS